MNRLLFLTALACIVAVACAFVSCSRQQANQTAAATSDEPSIPDTMLAVKTGEVMYTLYSYCSIPDTMGPCPSPPDTMGTVEMVVMSAKPSPASPAMSKTKMASSKKGAAAHEFVGMPLPPWPPDTMRLIFKHFHLKHTLHK